MVEPALESNPAHVTNLASPFMTNILTIDIGSDKGQHDLNSFRKILLKAASPRERAEKLQMKKITFNNTVWILQKKM